MRSVRPLYGYDDVVVALQRLMFAFPIDDEKHSKGKRQCYSVLARYGVQSVRDLRPHQYEGVITDCEGERKAAVDSFYYSRKLREFGQAEIAANRMLDKLVKDYNAKRSEAVRPGRRRNRRRTG